MLKFTRPTRYGDEQKSVSTLLKVKLKQQQQQRQIGPKMLREKLNNIGSGIKPAANFGQQSATKYSLADRETKIRKMVSNGEIGAKTPSGTKSAAQRTRNRSFLKEIVSMDCTNLSKDLMKNEAIENVPSPINQVSHYHNAIPIIGNDGTTFVQVLRND